MWVKENTTKTKKRLQQEGKFICHGHAIYGYTHNRKLRTREIVPAEAGTMRRVFGWAAGKSMRQIARMLDAARVASPGGGRWNPTTSTTESGIRPITGSRSSA